MRLLSLEEQKEIESKINNYKSMNIKNINVSEIDNIDNIKRDENLEPEGRVIDFLKKLVILIFLILMVMLLNFHIKKMEWRLRNVFIML